MENQLLGEIETVGRAYVDLEGRNIKKLEDLLQMETEVSILQGERSRYSQAFTSLNKSKDAHGMVATALGKQVEKELTYVKEFNEREKNINSQLVRSRFAQCSSVDETLILFFYGRLSWIEKSVLAKRLCSCMNNGKRN